MSENSTTTSHHNTMTVETESRTIGILYLVTSLPVIASNGIVMVVVVTSRELHLPTLWNIAFMALCDFSYGLHYLIFAVPSALIHQFAYPDSFIAPASCLLTLLYGQNALNVVIATVDRYMAVCWPLRYSQLMTAKRFTIAIVVAVAINICRLCAMVFPNTDVYYNADLALTMSKFDTLVSVIASVGLPVTSVFVIIGFLLKILREIARIRRQIHSFASQVSNRQFTTTVSLSAGLFCLCYFPTCVNIAWNLIYGLQNVSLVFMKFGIICLLANSLGNVVIYAAVYKPFRDAFLRLFCKGYYRRRAQMNI